jgi:hypothetical protein
VEETSPERRVSFAQNDQELCHTFEAAMHGNATSDWSINLARRGRDLLGGVTDGDHSGERIATSELRVRSDRIVTRGADTYSSEGNNEESEVVLDVESFHYTALDFLNSRHTIAGDVTVVGEGVQSR